MRWHARYAYLAQGIARDVLIETDGARFTSIQTGVPAGDIDSLGAVERLPGVVMPGFANTHSHVFHRGLRGRTHAGGGTFWTWREAMYALAERLDPDRYLALARATYAEMALAGITAVGEFHYLHHQPSGQQYADPNEMAHALTQAAADAGVRLTLLDTCYLSGGFSTDSSAPGVAPGAGLHAPLTHAQRRFGDGTVDAWAQRASALHDHRNGGPQHLVAGVAAHSVRAVPAESLVRLAEVAGLGTGTPLHIHLSEQRAENEACHAAYGMSPTSLLGECGLLGASTTAVHATHLSAADIAQLGRARVNVAFCPTTERDLADGIGPARELQDAGARLALGSDQHAVIDMFEEIRALEMHERLRTGHRGRFDIAALIDAATRHTSIGWPDAGGIAVGQRADLVAVRDDSVRTTGSEPDQIVFSATATDVDTVVVDGTTVVSGGHHRLGDVAAMMRQALEPLIGDNLWQS